MASRQKLFQLAKYATVTSAGGALLGLGSWKIWSRHAYFEHFTPDTDSLFHIPLMKSINPHNNPTLDDSCVYSVPISNIKTELLEDHRRGGPKLVNSFAQGMWGGYGINLCNHQTVPCI